jgi:hypothetical protein
MNANQTIAIEVPGGHQLTAADLSTLRSACEDLVAQACRSSSQPGSQIRTMSAEGWQVQSGLTWIARAERDRVSEEAVGETKKEALCRLCQLTGLHLVDGCP